MTTVNRTAPAHGERACYLRGCRRDECRNDHLRYMKRYRLERHQNGPRRTDVGPAAQHVRDLVADGWSQRQIADAANCSGRTISAILADKYQTMDVTLYARLLSAQPTLALVPATTYVDAIGTIRRVKALIALGHALVDIARRAGIVRTALGNIINHGHERITARHARSVAAVYIRLAGIPGSSVRSRARAARLGWPSPIAWGADIDDPNAQPEVETGTEPELGRDQLAALRRQEIEHLNRFGIPELDIARRLDMAESTVRGVLEELRAGVKRDRKKTAVAS